MKKKPYEFKKPIKGGPQSYDDAWRGLKRRKDQITRRNNQIKDLKEYISKLKTRHGELKAAINKYLDNDGSRDVYDAYKRSDAYKEIEILLKDK